MITIPGSSAKRRAVSCARTPVAQPAFSTALEDEPPGINKEWFSRNEWPVAGTLPRQIVTQIALAQNRPYSRIIYRLSCILDKLGLHHRQELLHLLNNLSDFTF
jgi:hypothetical protein